MRLAGFELYRYELPLRAPLRLKGATVRRREGLLLKLIGEGGSEGWGEASPLPGFSGESIEEAAEDLRTLIPPLLEREVSQVLSGSGDESIQASGEHGPSPSARFALELAAFDLLARRSGRLLPELLAPRPRATLKLSALLSGSPEQVLAEARRLRRAGYDTFKLKVGAQDVREDAALVRSLSESLGVGATLRLDANRAGSFEEAGEFASEASGSRYEYVEEPLARHGRLPDLVRETGLPVALDESLVGMVSGELGDHRYATAVVLKPTLIGGLSAALGFSGEASRLGMTPVVSSAYEAGVGTAALVALAAAIGGAPAGLDTYRRLAADVVSPGLDIPAPQVEVRAACAPRQVTGSYLTPIG